MKTQNLLAALVPLLALEAPSMFAQGTAFTYQGRLNDTGQPANGVYDLQLTIFDANTSGNLIAGPATNSATGVSNGLFTVGLDFGPGVFIGPPRWLEIGVRTNGGASFVTLIPRQELTPAPYAILAGDVSPANSNLARLNIPNTATTATGVPVITSGFVTGAIVTSGGSGYTTLPTVTVNDTSGSGALISATVSNGMVVSLAVHNAGSGYSTNASLAIGAPPSTSYQSFVSTNYFTGVNYLTNGNNVIAGNGAGLTNLNAWQLNGNIGTVAGPNFIGTLDSQPLELHADGQRVMRFEATNGLAPNVIGGSAVNLVDSGVIGAFIGAGGIVGFPNHVSSIFGAIVGGYGNTIQGNADNTAIGGGLLNEIDTGAWGGVIGGGYSNWIQSATGSGAAFGNASYATISGGYGNLVGTNANYSVIAGGGQNNIQSDGVIGGGIQNSIGAASFWSTIGGGQQNGVLAGSQFATIGGGQNNTIQTNSFESTIGGGDGNQIQPLSTGSMIGGGLNNTIQTNSFESTISGGDGNEIQANANSSTIGGGLLNQIQLGAFLGTISGGYSNSVQAPYATISGGDQNAILTNAYEATISGGYGNTIQSLGQNATIGGGLLNQIQLGAYVGTIGGGFSNTVSGTYGTIPGGSQNMAAGNYSLAAGRLANALHQGAFVWADSQTNAFSSTANDQFSVRAQGGVQFDPTTSLFFGSKTRQMLNLYTATGGTNYAIGVQTDTIYFRVNDGDSGTGFAWYRGGLHNDSRTNSGGGTTLMTLNTSGLTVNGTLVSSSDRNAKEHFQPIDPRQTLDKVASLPITTWNFKNDPATRHVGPMAQDFYAAFKVGPDDKHIATVDEGGVALAAIQGLNQKLESKEAEIEELKGKVRRLGELVNGLAAAQNAGFR
jgi:trimeric autotransporter adhesin